MTREEARVRLNNLKTDAELYDGKVFKLHLSDKQIEALDLAIKALEQEPKTGHWIKVTGKIGRLVCECDKCGWQQKLYTNFCPCCGTDMREVKK